MLKNPEVKFEGQNAKGYLFPMYTGKFFAQAQKLKELKPQQKVPLSPPSKSINFNNNSVKKPKGIEDPADYFKKIQELKKKLQRQISKYTKINQQTQQDNKNLCFTLDHKTSIKNLKSIRVFMPKQRQFDESLDPQKAQSGGVRHKQMMVHQKQMMKKKYGMRLRGKNKSEMCKKPKTEIEEGLQSHRRQRESNFLTNRQSKSIDCHEISLPSIPRKQNLSQVKYSFSISSSIKYTLPTNVSKILFKKRETPDGQVRLDQELSELDCQLLERASSVKKREKQINSSQRSFFGIGVGGFRKRKATSDKKQINARQTFLKGWDFTNQRENDNINSCQLLS